MKVKIKKLHPAAIIPKYAKPDDAGMDLVAVRTWKDKFGNTCYGTGLALELPPGYVSLLFPRSSVSKTNLRLSNAVGVIDPGYRGEVILKFDNIGPNKYEVGDRVGQIIILPFPKVEFVETDQLSRTARGTGGFGSSGS